MPEAPAPTPQAADDQVPQFTEAESAVLYDEMLATGRIIQVTSGGVRVFDQSGLFLREEVLKAKLVFPLIDITPKVERLLNHLMEHDDLKIRRVRGEIHEAIYRPIKASLNELVNDSRVFFGDPAGLEQIKTDLHNVIDRLDMLTLGMLNDILKGSELDFRRHIEAGAYCGLAGSVVFGDYKRKLTDKRVVEDLIMIGLMFNLGPDLSKSTSFQELCRTSKSFYDVERVLDEVRTKPDEPTNILSEILAVALRFIKALDADDARDPLRGLTALMGGCTPSHAIAVGALAQKYAIDEYMLGYLRNDEELRDMLRASEDSFQQTLHERMSRENNPAVKKLGDLFQRQLRYKATIRRGADTLRRLDEFLGVLLHVGALAAEALAKLEGTDDAHAKAAASRLKTIAQAVGACSAFHERHHDPSQWPSVNSVPGGAYLVAYRWSEEIGYRIQNTIRTIERCYDRAMPPVKALGDAALDQTLARLDEHMQMVQSFRLPVGRQVLDAVHVVEVVDLAFSGEARLALVTRVPEHPVNIVVDSDRLDAVLYALLDQIAEASTSAEGEPSAPVTLGARASNGRCLIEIRDPAGRMPHDMTALVAQTEAASPGAGLHIDVKPGAGATFVFDLPLHQPTKPGESSM
ncbi:MAG: HAMP domain-containing histidine kinase [Verrucomicrobia bacterium]|nr:HAMP domain-containing histidine kinase [Verrucomicrobiota bacterium]